MLRSMTEKSIQVLVGNKWYTLSVLEDEVPLVKQLAQNLNDKVSLMKDNYGITDIQDMLAMAALEQGMELLKKNISVDDVAQLEQKLTFMQQRLMKVLSE
jgi:cell division protein ZapA (FtsZ GTPase activity inhibitor)